MALPAIGAALSLLGRAALSGLGGAARIGSYATRAGMRNAAFRALGHRARNRRRARRRRAPLVGRALMRRARRMARGPAFTRRARMRKLRIRAQMGRLRRTQAAFNALPASAPRRVRQRAQAAFQQAQTSLQNMVDPQGGQDQFSQGLAMMANALAGSTRGLVGLATASYAASRGMEVIGRSLAQYNGAYAGTNAMLDVSRMGRSIQVAGATSDSYSKMIASLNRLEQATVPFQIAAMKVANWMLEKINDATAAVLAIAKSPMFGWMQPGPPSPAPDWMAIALRARATVNVNQSPPGNARNINPAGTPPGRRPPPPPPPPPPPKP